MFVPAFTPLSVNVFSPAPVTTRSVFMVTPFVAMELLDGSALDKLLNTRRKLSLSEVLKIGRATAKALAKVHACGVIHGDIKWDNFLVLPDGGVRLVDWELADFGDPSWDAGSVLQGFLTSWVTSIQAPPDTVADFALHVGCVRSRYIGRIR